MNILEMLKNSTLSMCACMGPQNGEPFCPCQMRAKGLPTTPLWTEEKREELKKALEEMIRLEDDNSSWNGPKY